jgi:hypothetical protein
MQIKARLTYKWLCYTPLKGETAASDSHTSLWEGVRMECYLAGVAAAAAAVEEAMYQPLLPWG